MAEHAAAPTKPQRGVHLKSNTTPAALHTSYHMTSAWWRGNSSYCLKWNHNQVTQDRFLFLFTLACANLIVSTVYVILQHKGLGVQLPCAVMI